MLFKALLAERVPRLHNDWVLKRAGAYAAGKAARVQMVRLLMVKLCTLLCHACFGVQLVQHPLQDVRWRATLNLLKSFLHGQEISVNASNERRIIRSFMYHRCIV